jgi:hypothetical protein
MISMPGTRLGIRDLPNEKSRSWKAMSSIRFSVRDRCQRVPAFHHLQSDDRAMAAIMDDVESGTQAIVFQRRDCVSLAHH